MCLVYIPHPCITLSGLRREEFADLIWIYLFRIAPWKKVLILISLKQAEDDYDVEYIPNFLHKFKVAIQERAFFFH